MVDFPVPGTPNGMMNITFRLSLTPLLRSTGASEISALKLLRRYSYYDYGTTAA